MAVKKVKMRLQGHEKFALREGWINKGLYIVGKSQDVFLRPDATDVFGIGSNMVKSLRYWMKAFGLIVENGSSGAQLTDIGNLILKYDPYIENVFTLWIMHSNIVRNIENATTWYMYFNYCDAEDLDKSEIETILYREVSKYAMGQKFSEKSLYNDIDVLLNMYSKNKEKSDPEEKNISPFSQLSLIKNVEGNYIKKRPDKKILSEIVILYELTNMLKDRDSISIEEAVYGINGLSKIYNLTSVMANDYLDRLDAGEYIRVDRTAGLDIIYLTKDMNDLDVIKEYYKNC